MLHRVHDPKRSKLGPRAIKSVFVGYAENSQAYRLLDLESNVIVESRDMKVFEYKFINDSINDNEQVLVQGSSHFDPCTSTNQKR